MNPDLEQGLDRGRKRVLIALPLAGDSPVSPTLTTRDLLMRWGVGMAGTAGILAVLSRPSVDILSVIDSKAGPGAAAISMLLIGAVELVAACHYGGKPAVDFFVNRRWI